MRIPDDRYSRELCLDLALRFLRHEARTQTNTRRRKPNPHASRLVNLREKHPQDC
jgi:hypothetical protein